MTTTHARTANEQRIAFLECQLVTMRGALENLMAWGLEFDDKRLQYISVQVGRGDIEDAEAALSDSTDYANKVVVGRKEPWAFAVTCPSGAEADYLIFECLDNAANQYEYYRGLSEEGDDWEPQIIHLYPLTRLDSLRKADAATAAAHAEGGKT